MLRSSASNYAGRFAGLIVWFFLTPFVLRRLGPSDFGLWVLGSALIGYGSLLDLGIGGAITKYLAEYRARGDLTRARSLVITALWVYTGLGLATLVLTVVLAPVLPQLLQLPETDRSTATGFVLLVGVTVAITLPCITAGAVLEGLQRYDLTSLATTASSLFGALATVTVLLAGGGVLAAVSINIPATLVAQVVSVWSISRVAPELGFGRGTPTRGMVRLLVSFGGVLLVGRLSKRLKTRTDELVIAAVLPISFVTPYAIAHKLSDLAQNLTDQFMRVLLPLASELHATDEHDRLRALYTAGTRLTLVICVPMACTLIILAKPILTAWVGASYADEGGLVTILTVASLIDTAQWPAVSILQGMARYRPVALISICSALANLGLSLALVHPFGLVGVALGTLIPTSVEGLLLVTPYALRVLRLGPADVLGKSVAPALLPALPMVLVLAAVEPFLPPSLLVLALAAGGAGLMYAAVYLLWCATSAERDLSRQLLALALTFARARVRWPRPAER
ncbi:MAG: oligosaccharide flippase family protein [Chloroflexi bacterium]|nr:oligosaccharide flippase family protein [Chloroflexota bacterium]